jgi:peptide/nickel transport system permease protein
MAVIPTSPVADASGDPFPSVELAVVDRRNTTVQRLLVAGSLGFLALVIFVALFPGLIAPGDPLALNLGAALHPPSLAYPLGTDEYGRSILQLLVYGARAALVVGVVCAGAGGIVGGAMGIVAGFFGGGTDQGIMRLNDVLMCFPGLLLALIISAALGPSLRNEIIAVAVAAIPTYARVARGETLSVRGSLYVDAAIVGGLTRWRIITRHVLPNVIGPLVAVATITVGVSIVLAASLSFLGLGPAGGVPDWGKLLAGGEDYISTAWWISTFPGIAITLVVVATNLLGDWLRDKLDVRVR